MVRQSKPLNNYDDVREILDKALEMKGAFIECSSYGKAIQLRHRMNQFRLRDREENTEIYPPGHTMYGRSFYDSLTFRIAHNSSQILIEPRDFGSIKITYGPPRPEEKSVPEPVFVEENPDKIRS
jgi:hypothetical protein